ncbi:MAG TPA: peroxiredoxin, partial [Methylophilaceae bacterium]|nr:peroxiredoxin [Methylophilaceae bacterium]
MKILLLVAVLGLVLLLFRSVSMAGQLPQLGQAAPDFSLPDQNGKTHRLSDYAGQWLVLYFYPKDDTPGCTKEDCSFRDDLQQLEKLVAKVGGIRVDEA